MASAATFPKLRFGLRCHNYSQTIDPTRTQIKFCNGCSCQISTRMLLVSDRGRSLRKILLTVSAAASGRGSSVAADESKKDLSLENVKTSIVSRSDEKINVRVQLPGKATQKVFDEALVILARDAPPVPGFRKSKGDTQQHPLADAWQKPGHQVRSPGNNEHHNWGFCEEGECHFRKLCAKLTLQVCARYDNDLQMTQENLKVNPEIETTQSEAEMESAFTPGSAFGFNVILQLEKTDTDEDSEEQPDNSE